MGQISVDLPIIGNPVSSEDPKVREALSDIVQELNGRIDNNNIAEAGVANINGDRLADSSIPTAKLESDAVTADKLRDDASTDANRAVTTNHIRDDAVTADKLRDDASVDANRAVTSNHIRDNAVVRAKLADNAIGTAEIENGAVTGAKIAAATSSALTYQNSAVEGSPAPLATKFADGLVVLSGIVNRTSASKATTYATLPSGYRPIEQMKFVCVCESSVTIAEVTIAAAGTISFSWSGTPSPTPFGFRLDGISFYAS